jgi:hypothetical protein
MKKYDSHPFSRQYHAKHIPLATKTPRLVEVLTWPGLIWHSPSRKTEKYGHESHRNQKHEWLHWRRLAAIYPKLKSLFLLTEPAPRCQWRQNVNWLRTANGLWTIVNKSNQCQIKLCPTPTHSVVAMAWHWCQKWNCGLCAELTW